MYIIYIYIYTAYISYSTIRRIYSIIPNALMVLSYLEVVSPMKELTELIFAPTLLTMGPPLVPNKGW